MRYQTLYPVHILFVFVLISASAWVSPAHAVDTFLRTEAARVLDTYCLNPIYQSLADDPRAMKKVMEDTADARREMIEMAYQFLKDKGNRTIYGEDYFTVWARLTKEDCAKRWLSLRRTMPVGDPSGVGRALPMIQSKHVVNVSGGKDSTALYLLALESQRDFLPVFADTGHEHQETYEYVRALPE